MHSGLVLFTSLAGLVVASPALLAQTSRLPTVTLASGVVVGTTTLQAVTKATQSLVVVKKFLGVPYAAPPERFSPPQDPVAWQGKLNATSFKPACPQFFNTSFVQQFADNPVAPESEDCLYANVWVPTGEPSGLGGKPVMFWIHGGGLSFGWSGDPSYDGASLAASHNVIVVSFGYRMNVFGFSNSPEIPLGQQNSGFLDQRKALDWVQENIHKFGGNPNRVTIFGQSAGGWSVKQLLANPPDPLTYHAAIVQSEGTYYATADPWKTLTANLSCAAAASPIACMRTLPMETIKDTIENLHIIFQPVPDNITSSANIAVQINDGTFADVPVMIGNVANEGTFFEIGKNNVTAFLQAQFSGITPVQQAAAAQYPPGTNAFQEISDIFGNFAFLCPTGDIANLASNKGYDIWRYYFNASFPNYQPFPGANVWHTSEIPLIFGTYPKVNATQQQINLSDYFQTAWAHFAHTHRPPKGWPKVGHTANTVMDIGVNGSSAGILVSNNTIDSKCAIYQSLIARVGL